MKRFIVGVVTACAGWLAMGCGPSPAYEPEPRTPGDYAPPQPRPADELAAQPQPQQEAPQDPQQQPGDVPIGASADEYADTDPSALQDFKPALDNHGAWVDDATYGTVWVPAETEVGSDFQPYVTAGHWTYSDQENWVWVSDYDWGWAPFHYGRWVYLPSYGWSWIPGRTYSGAWVVWRTGGYGYEYVGWAPAAPDWYWYHGYAVGWGFGWYYPHYYYCHHDYLYRPYVGNYVVRGGTPAAAAMEARTSPYHPASPGVGGVNGTGHTPATPGVGGATGNRVAATPHVGGTAGGGGGVGGGSNTRIAMGPRPNEIGVKGENVPAPPTSGGVAKAHAFASPGTAQALGGSAPANTRPRRVEDGVAGARAPAGDRGMSPSVANRLEPAARAPQYAQSHVPDSHPTPNGATQSHAAAPSYSQAAPRNITPSHSAPTYSAPSRSAPTYSAPSHSAPTYSAPSHSSAPSFHSSAPSHPTYSAPSVSHSSAPSRSAPSSSRSSGRRR